MSDSLLDDIFAKICPVFHEIFDKNYIEGKIRKALDWLLQGHRGSKNIRELYDFDIVMDCVAHAFGNEFHPMFYGMLKEQHHERFSAVKKATVLNYPERRLSFKRVLDQASLFFLKSIFFDRPMQIHYMSFTIQVLSMKMLPFLSVSDIDLDDQGISLESAATIDETIKHETNMLFREMKQEYIFHIFRHRSLELIHVCNASKIVNLFQNIIEDRDKCPILTLFGKDEKVKAVIRDFYFEETFRYDSMLASLFIILEKRESAILTLDLGKTKSLRARQKSANSHEMCQTWKMIKEGKEKIRLDEISKQLSRHDENSTALVYYTDFHGILHCCVLNGEVTLFSFTQLDKKDLISQTQMLLKPCDVQMRRDFSFFTSTKEETNLLNDTSTCSQVTNRKPFQQTNTYIPQSQLQTATLRLKELNATWASKNLFRLLLQPVMYLFKGNKLIIVPDQSLFILPFSSLLDENGISLSMNYSVQIVPALHHILSSFTSNLDSRSIGPAIFLGNPKMDFICRDGKRLTNPPIPLPYATIEVQQLAAMFNTRPVIQEDATKSMVFLNLEQVSILHVASHGDPNFGWIYFCPDFALVQPGNAEEEAYLLREQDLSVFHIKARLVFLSCCSTGRGWVSCNGVFGIARAFLASGARSVIVTLWPIDDLKTLDFTHIFYTFLCEEKSVCESLRLAMIHFQNHYNPAYRLYTSWAPFQVLGEDIKFTKEEIAKIRELGTLSQCREDVHA